MNHPKTANPALIGAIFSSSLSVLLFEMAQIHIFSQSLPPVLAYTAISLAMTGFGMGAILLSIFPSLFKGETSRNLSIFAYIQAVAMVASTAVFARMSGSAFSGLTLSWGPLIFGILIPCTLPYFFSGLFLGLVFSEFTQGIGRLYFWNLLGSGLGTVIMAFQLTPGRAEAAIYTAAVISLIAALLLALPTHRRIAAGAILTILALTVTFPLVDKVFPFEPSSSRTGAPTLGAREPMDVQRGEHTPSVPGYPPQIGRTSLAGMLPEAMSGISSGTKTFLDIITTDNEGQGAMHRQTQVGLDSNYTLISRLIGQNETQTQKNELEMLKRFWAAIVIMALVSMVLPAITFGRRLSSSYRPLLWVFPYFFLVGMCFMMLEVGIINRFAPFIGSGSISASIVLASILISSGLGSYSSEFIKKRPETLIAIGTVLVLLAALLFRELYPRIIDFCAREKVGLPVRGLVAGLITAPLGYGMGWFFPSGLKVVSNYMNDQRLMPWAISMNGFASVFGSIAALPFSINYGFSRLFTVALVGYALAGTLSFLVFRRRAV